MSDVFLRGFLMNQDAMDLPR
jgi:hypothetical protein